MFDFKNNNNYDKIFHRIIRIRNFDNTLMRFIIKFKIKNLKKKITEITNNTIITFVNLQH